MQRRQLKHGLAIGVAIGAMTAIGSPDTVVVDAAKDNSIYTTGNTSNGIGTTLYCGRTGSNGGGTVQRSLFAFDLDGQVPPGSTVTGASLTLTLVTWSDDNSSPQTHAINRVLLDWGEGTSSSKGGMGAPATPGDATWTHTFFPTDFWGQSGGLYAASASATVVIISVPTDYTWGSTPEMVADVQCWIDEPDCNFGWLMTGNEADLSTAKRFASREWFDPAERPVLTIDFTPPDPCPADFDDDGAVAIADLLFLLASWGGPDADLDDDGDTGIGDLLTLLAAWGPCAG